MKTIAIGLQKGGTGKTTLAAELAGYSQTILIDADPQGNASAWIGPDSLSAKLAGVLFERYPLEQAITSTDTTDLALLPSAGLGWPVQRWFHIFTSKTPFCLANFQEIVFFSPLIAYRILFYLTMYVFPNIPFLRFYCTLD